MDVRGRRLPDRPDPEPGHRPAHPVDVGGVDAPAVDLGWVDGPRIVPAGHAICPTGGHLDPTMFQAFAPHVLPLTVEEGIANSVPMPVISASLFARFASRQESSPTMQAVAALRGQFGGHQVMTTAEGEKLRAEAQAGPKSAETAKAKAAAKEKPTKSAAKAASKGRQAASAGPSSGSGATGAPSGPTSGTASTRKRAAKKA